MKSEAQNMGIKKGIVARVAMNQEGENVGVCCRHIPNGTLVAMPIADITIMRGSID